MSSCGLSFPKAALVIVDDVGVLELFPLGALCMLDGSGEEVASFGLPLKSNRGWALLHGEFGRFGHWEI